MQVYELSQAAELLFKRACAVSTRLRHYYVEPEHFLLAMVIDVHTPIARMLDGYGMNPDTVLAAVVDMHETYSEGTVRVIEPLAPVSTKVINAAIEVTQVHGEMLATPAHILVMLIQSKHEQILQVFDAHGINPDRVAHSAVKSILEMTS